MLTMIAQGLSTSPALALLVGVLLGFALLGAIAQSSGARRRRLWLRFAYGLFWIMFLVSMIDLTVDRFGRMSGEGWACAVIFVAIAGAYLLLTKSGRSALGSGGRQPRRPEPFTRKLGRLTVYVVVTTLVVLVVGISLSNALIELLEHHAPDRAPALTAPIILGVFIVLMFATLYCLWRWLEGPRARRL
ncbi:MAG TPA: hypothetical protein VMZ31_15105 [Phycisphaerae bacterium]|nr:hypothetical protein [Phycisphaerae bacterium]